jgi:hypothetical protein
LIYLPEERDVEEGLKEELEPPGEAEKRGKASSVITNGQSACWSEESYPIRVPEEREGEEGLNEEVEPWREAEKRGVKEEVEPWKDQLFVCGWWLWIIFPSARVGLRVIFVSINFWTANEGTSAQRNVTG